MIQIWRKIKATVTGQILTTVITEERSSRISGSNGVKIREVRDKEVGIGIWTFK